MTRRLLALALLVSGCNVSPFTPQGGATLPARGDCPSGLAVVSSDYLSSEVALLLPSGDVASPSLVSSASSAASGLSAAFSGDIVVEPAPSRPGELAIVDRFGTNVITFVDSRTAAVRAQLPVGGGFEANAQGYLELDEHHALVPRLGENAAPGREPFDQGSDLLLIDPSVPEIRGSLAMPRRAGFIPAPVAATRVGERVVVTLQHAKPDYSAMADGELVGIDLDGRAVRYRLGLEGSNCGKSEPSPSGRLLGVACEGYVDRRGTTLEPEKSAFILLDPSFEPPTVVRRFSAAALFGGAIQTNFEFADERLVLIKTQTALGADDDNRLFSLDVETGETTLLASAGRDESGAGVGIAFAGISCASGCGDPCFVCDRSRGELLRFRLRSGSLWADEPVTIHGAGLPPLGVTPFW